MKISRLSDTIGGWFVGDFPLAQYRTPQAEVAIKYYAAGDSEPSHVHRIAHELTCVVGGKIRMNELVLTAGDIVMLSPGEACDFEALEDSATCVVKLPSCPGDKYLEE